MEKDDLYILLKPEIRNHSNYLESFLKQGDFNLKSVHPVKYWDRLSLDIYSHQMEINPIFARGVHAYLWLSKQLFGNDSVVFLLEEQKEKGNLQKKLEKLDETKKNFRKCLYNKGGNALKIFLNMQKVNTYESDKLGINGKIQIGNQVLQDPEMEGRWEDFYFKYIHAPNPSPENFKREMNILKKYKVFDYSINPSNWELMKKLNTLTQPWL